MTLHTDDCLYEFTVRESCSVEVVARSSKALEPGDTVEFQFPNSWNVLTGPSFTRELQTDDPEGEHYLTVVAEGAAFDCEITARHLYHPEGNARHGRLITATLREGEVAADAPLSILYANTFAPYVAEDEVLWLRVNGKAPVEPVALCTVGGPACDLRVLAPCVVRPGEEFEVLIVSLDAYQNCSTTTYEALTLTLDDGAVVADGIDFVGSIRVSLSLCEEGVRRFVVGDVVSNAVKVSATATKLRWGDTHIHTKVSTDAQGSDPYGYAREVSGLDFGAACDHWFSLGDAGTQQIVDWADGATAEGGFAAILADERNPGNFTGHHNFYYRDADAFWRYQDVTPVLGEDNCPDFDMKRAPTDPPEMMLVPHHTGIAFHNWRPGQRGSAVDVDADDDCGLRPIMEVYSHHGQSELYAPQHALAYETNRMRRPERRANASVPGAHYAQAWWMEGRRLGVIGSSDDHAGQAGIRHGGVAAVWSDELSSAAIFDALFARQCYATTGERILVEFDVDGVTMGNETTRPRGATVPIRLRVWGTRKLVRIEVLRYRFGVDKEFVPILTDSPRPESMDYEAELEDEIAGPCMYYARVTQDPVDFIDMAWSSPVWVDVNEE